MGRKALSQYYTKPEVWEIIMSKFKDKFAKFKVVDPCAGDGYMIKKYFPDGHAYDIDPLTQDVQIADMEKLDYSQFGTCAVVSNIPFNSTDYPIRKLNYIGSFDNVKLIAVANLEKYEYHPVDSLPAKGPRATLNEMFHLVDSLFIPGDLFEPAVKVSITFQIWERKSVPRPNLDHALGMNIGSIRGKCDLVIQWPNKRYLLGGEKSPVYLRSGFVRAPGRSIVGVKLMNKEKSIHRVKKELSEHMLKLRATYDYGPQGFGPGHLKKHLLREMRHASLVKTRPYKI